MSHTSPYTSSTFKVQRATHRSSKVIRLRYTADPLAASSVGANDATNPTNYTLAGPGTNYITTIEPAGDDPQSVDITLAAPLVLGRWVINVSNVETQDGDTLVAPTSAALLVTSVSTVSPLSNGAITDSAERVLRKHFPSVFKGTYWSGLIAGLSTAHRHLWDFGQSAFDQLFPVSASGVYLDRHANAARVDRSKKAGFSDEQFRKLLIQVSSKKLTIPAMLGALEVFYGSEALRANISTSGVEPYALEDADDVTLRFNGKEEITVVFDEDDFDDISGATAAELGAVFTRTFHQAGLNSYAIPVTDPLTGDTRLTIYSSALGLGSSIEVLGGRAQNHFLFPTQVDTIGEVGLSWDVEVQPTGTDFGTVRLKTDVTTTFDVQEIQIGDYVNIFGTPFNASNRGSFTITNVVKEWNGASYDQYVDFINTDAVAQAGVVQVNEADLLFFRPTKNGIYKEADRTVVVAQTVAGEVEVRLPATSIAITRSEYTGAYGNVADPLADIVSVVRQSTGALKVTTSTAHGRAQGDQLFVDGLVATKALLPKTTVATSNPGNSSYSLRSVVSNLANYVSLARTLGTAFNLNGSIFLVGGTVGGSPRTAVDKLQLTASLVGGATQYAYEWSIGTAFPDTIESMASAVLTTGIAIVGGGIDSISITTDKTYTFDGTTWSAPILMNDERRKHTFAHRNPQLGDGLWSQESVVAIGGLDNVNARRTSIEEYEPDGAWTVLGNLSRARYDHASVALTNGDVLVVGGNTAITSADRHCEVVHYVGGAFDSVVTTGRLTRGRAKPVLVALPDGRAIVIGGGTGSASADCEVWDPQTGHWEPGPTMMYSRADHSAVLIDLIEGGQAILVCGSGLVPEMLDLRDWKWKSICTENTLASDRTIGYLVKVGDNHAVFTAGLISGAATQTAEMFIQGFPESWRGRLNGEATVSAITSPTIFEMTLNESARLYTITDVTDLTITPMKAGASVVAGPFAFDKQGAAVTATETTTSMILETGKHYTALTVADASEFPDERGFIALGFGTEDAVYPIPYYGRRNDTSLILDYATGFTRDIASGTKVTLLHNRGAWVPEDPETLGSFYLTASAAGRVAAQSTIEKIAAAGMDVNTIVKYPGDRGLSGEGKPTLSAQKLSSIVSVFAGDGVDAEVEAAQEEVS